MEDNLWSIISSIATSAMAIATFATIYYNNKRWKKEDLEWEEDERARLVYSIFTHDNYYSIKLLNVGKRTAHTIKWEVVTDFTKLYSDFPEIISKFQNTDNSGNIHLKPNEHTLIPLIPINLYNYLEQQQSSLIGKLSLTPEKSKLDMIQQVALMSKITLTGIYNNTYKINEEIIIQKLLSIKP